MKVILDNGYVIEKEDVERIVAMAAFEKRVMGDAVRDVMEVVAGSAPGRLTGVAAPAEWAPARAQSPSADEPAAPPAPEPPAPKAEVPAFAFAAAKPGAHAETPRGVEPLAEDAEEGSPKGTGAFGPEESPERYAEEFASPEDAEPDDEFDPADFVEDEDGQFEPVAFLDEENAYGDEEGWPYGAEDEEADGIVADPKGEYAAEFGFPGEAPDSVQADVASPSLDDAAAPVAAEAPDDADAELEELRARLLDPDYRRIDGDGFDGHRDLEPAELAVLTDEQADEYRAQRASEVKRAMVARAKAAAAEARERGKAQAAPEPAEPFEPEPAIPPAPSPATPASGEFPQPQPSAPSRPKNEPPAPTGRPSRFAQQAAVPAPAAATVPPAQPHAPQGQSRYAQFAQARPTAAAPRQAAPEPPAFQQAAPAAATEAPRYAQFAQAAPQQPAPAPEPPAPSPVVPPEQAYGQDQPRKRGILDHFRPKREHVPAQAPTAVQPEPQTAAQPEPPVGAAPAGAKDLAASVIESLEAQLAEAKARGDRQEARDLAEAIARLTNQLRQAGRL